MQSSQQAITSFSALHLIGESPQFHDVLSVINKMARCDAPVLLEGETGTGKEVVARAIHKKSNRSTYPFVPVNCGALPDNLIENELFGHEKGAYTDANCAQPGVIAQAQGGILFLDEIEALPYKGQVALLRFLQDWRYRPLGGNSIKQADIRVIAAGNVSLSILVEQGEFRSDLYYRLNTLSLELPPLRHRRDDIILLAEHFMQQYREKYHEPHKRFHPDTIKAMVEYEWLGNIRELENTIHREFLFSDGPVVRIGQYGPHQKVRHKVSDENSEGLCFIENFRRAKEDAINRFEAGYLHWLLKKTKGNITQAAKLSGKERRALGKLIKKHDLEVEQFRG